MTSYIGALARPMSRHGAMLSRLLGDLAARWQNRRRRRRDLAVLAGQPDYLLKDIGLARHEIEHAVRGQFRIS
jgi:uncharacterized protein YjiS (DUF1127 family)